MALTLAVAYLTTAAQQTAREDQSALVHQQANTLDAAIDHPATARRPTRAELAAASRANFVDRAKDKWNSDVESTVRWLQGADLNRARERAEDKAGVLAEAVGADEAVERVRAAAVERVGPVVNGLGDMVDRSIATGKDVISEVNGTEVGGRVGETDVEKALRQRYEKGPVKPKTVSEVLQERYIPLSQRDNTKLRGI